MLEQTVTIYNRYGNDNPVRWGRRVLTGVHWKSGFGVSTSTTGVSGGTVESLLIIPLDNRYCSPEAYHAAESKNEFWTLQDGDAIVDGAGPDMEITGNIKKALPGCKLITGMIAHIYGSPMDHWEVTAK